MTISLNTPRNTYTASAGQTDFTIGFEFFAVADVKAYKNGSLYGTVTIGTSYENDMWLPVAGDTSGGNAGRLEFNFGNGYFGTTAVSSAGTNASNIGIFEYNVPTGYTALSTKGLNE